MVKMSMSEEELIALRWPEGVRCVQCNHPNVSCLRVGGWQCQTCRHQFTLTSGTRLHHTHIAPAVWARAISCYTQGEQYPTIAGLAGELGCDYRTALRMSRLIREAFPAVDQLSNHVLLDVFTLQLGKTSYGPVLIAVKIPSIHYRNTIECLKLHRLPLEPTAIEVGAVLQELIKVDSYLYTRKIPLLSAPLSYSSFAKPMKHFRQDHNTCLPALRMALQEWYCRAGHARPQSVDEHLKPWACWYEHKQTRTSEELFHTVIRQLLTPLPLWAVSHQHTAKILVL